MNDRIRWTEDADTGETLGYVGSFDRPAFRIWPPDVLLVYLAGDAQHMYHGDTTDGLKAEAERLLTEFIASLGAVFPGHPGDSVTIDLSEQDTRAVLANALDEYADWCRARADEDAGDREWRTRWAEIAERMCEQVTEPGESAVTTGEGGPMISGYCYEGDERDDWDAERADHSACMPDTPFECSCDCHDWSEQEWADAEEDEAAAASALAEAEDTLPGENGTGS